MGGARAVVWGAWQRGASSDGGGERQCGATVDNRERPRVTSGWSVSVGVRGARSVTCGPAPALLSYSASGTDHLPCRTSFPAQASLALPGASCYVLMSIAMVSADGCGWCGAVVSRVAYACTLWGPSCAYVTAFTLKIRRNMVQLVWFCMPHGMCGRG